MNLKGALSKTSRAVRHPRELPARIANRLEVAMSAEVREVEPGALDVDDWMEEFHRRMAQSWPCSACLTSATIVHEAFEAIRAFGVVEHDLDPGAAEVLWALMLHLRAKKIVETGVARGVTSRMVLEALERNDGEGLWSVDLPPLGVDGASIGIAVPEHLKHRWSYVRGSSRAALRRTLVAAGTLDGFIHDSLHTYRTMTFEFRTARPFLAPRAFVFADDVDGNRAFQDFSSDLPGAWSSIVRHRDKGGAFGVLVSGADVKR